jgi:hypothetical protein
MNRQQRRRLRDKYGCRRDANFNSTTNPKKIEKTFYGEAFGVDLARVGVFVVAATDAALVELVAIYGPLPETMTTRFPDGHREMFFRGRRSAGEIESGINIITDWTIGAGSVVDGGRVTLATRMMRPGELPEAPAWLLALPVLPYDTLRGVS